MKEKTLKKLRFNVQQVEKPPKASEEKRKKILASIGDKLIEQRKNALASDRTQTKTRRVSFSNDKENVTEATQKSRQQSGPEQNTTAKPVANQVERTTREKQISPGNKSPDRKGSPATSPASKPLPPLAIKWNSGHEPSQGLQRVKASSQRDKSLSKGRNLIMNPPTRTLSYEYPPVPSDEDSLCYPFEGSRKLSDSDLLAAHPATNVVYLINKERKRRIKENFDEEIAAVHDRIRRALEYADIYEDDAENKDEQDGSEPKTGFDTRSKREILKVRHELIYKVREQIENCHKRMVLMSEVNQWILAQQRDLEEDLVSEEDMEDQEFQSNIGHKKIMYTLEKLTNCLARILEVGKKFIEVSRRLIHSTTKGKVEKIQIVDEKTMLTNKAKWDQATASIHTVFDDAQKWVKGAPIKAALKNGKKQYEMILNVVEKRLKDLAEMSELVEDLQNKLMMSKEMIDAQSKEAEESRRMVDRLGKELKAMQSHMLLTMETNQKLKEQLEQMEEQVEEMKAELSKRPPTPPTPPSPSLLSPPPPPRPPTPPPKQSESDKLLMEKTMEQMSLLQEEIRDYKMIVNNLTSRVYELEELLEKEQKHVESLKESLDSRPVIEERPPEPKVEMPSVPEVPSDSSASYYKTLLSGMKKDFQDEVDKLKEHLKKEQIRNDANVRRLEQGHKDQIQIILKDCMRVLRAIVHFRDQVAIAFEKEGFVDPANQLQQLPKLAMENVAQDPKDVLMFMVGNAVDYLHSMEVVMNHTLLAMKVMQKTGRVDSQPPVSQEQVYKQMEERMEEISQPSTIQKAVKSPVKRVVVSNKKDKQYIKKLEDMVIELEDKYETLLERYKLVFQLYTEQKKEMEGLQAEFDKTIEKKMKEKETMVVSAIQTELKEKRAVNKEQLQMSIADQRKNLGLLDKALDENKITQELHQMATGLLHQAMDIPRKRFRYLIERYIAHRAVKDAEARAATVLREEKLPSSQRSDLMLYMDQMQNRLEKGLSMHHNNMERLESERRSVFKEIWSQFNEVLLDNGVLQVGTASLHTKRHSIQKPRVRPHYEKLKTLKVATCRMDPSDITDGLVGNNLPLMFKKEKPMWKPFEPGETMSPLPAITTPLFLDMEVNKQRLLAKRKLEVGPRRTYSLSKSRSYTICNQGSVDYIANTLIPHS